MGKIERAILSVTDKTGITDFARALHEMDVEIISTGGTAKTIRESGVPVRDIYEITGFPEMMNGRVKTLHPKVHGGILALRDNEEHRAAMTAHDIRSIDMVVVNLYQFEKAVAKEGVTLADAIENIDIGGPTMLRSSAKNFKFVTVVVDPADYDGIINEMRQNKGATTLETRFRLACKVFKTTGSYDQAITDYLKGIDPASDAYFK